MKIYSLNNIEIADVVPEENSLLYQAIMQSSSLTLVFNSWQKIEIPLHSYVVFEGITYTLYYPAQFVKHSTHNYEYTLTLYAAEEGFKLYKYKDLYNIPYGLKFFLTAKPVDFLTLLVDNLNLHGGNWLVGDCIDTEEKTISFNHEYCYDVLNRLASEFDTEWEIEGKLIHLRKVSYFKEDPLPLSYGKGSGFLPGVGQKNYENKQAVGVVYVEGGTRNIDYSKYGYRSLLLPKSQTLEYTGKMYYTDTHGTQVRCVGNDNVQEDSFDGTDFYPSRIGEISEVVVVDAEKNFYDIIDTSIPESLNYKDYRIAGEKAVIKFQSGNLAGREFDILQSDTDLTGYNHTLRKFELVPAEQDGFIMPGGSFVPEVGDKYVVFNIAMPEAYICDNTERTGASWDLFRAAVKYFSERENPIFTFIGNIDPIYSQSRWYEIGGKFIPGGHILYSDSQFLPQGEVIRIVSMKRGLLTPYAPEVTLSNAPVLANFTSSLDKIEAAEVVRAADKKEILGYTKRRFKDAMETVSLLQGALLDYDPGITPVTVQTMSLLVGDKNRQFTLDPRNIYWDANVKKLFVSQTTLKSTITATVLRSERDEDDYYICTLPAYQSPTIESQQAMYLYAKCPVDTSGAVDSTFLLSVEAKAFVEGDYYNFLVGILNKEQDEGDRSFVALHGLSEITPGQIITDLIVSEDGKTYINLKTGEFRFKSKTESTNLADWVGGTDDKLVELEEGVHNKGYRIEKVTSLGYEFYREGQVYQATLGVVVYHNDIDVTDIINIQCFKWQRVSENEPGDIIWNELHLYSGHEISITQDDLVGDTSFILQFYDVETNKILTTKF